LNIIGLRQFFMENAETGGEKGEQRRAEEDRGTKEESGAKLLAFGKFHVYYSMN
jgi:hypothetical protein